jgi:hypothetical protein
MADIHTVKMTHKTADTIISALRFMEEHPGIEPEEAKEAGLTADLILETFDRQHMGKEN